MKKSIRVYFSDFWVPFDIENNIYTELLRPYYDLVITPDTPDFLFHSCFGYRHAQYSCVKICCIGENMTPDFNISDYAYGFDHMEFGDRYMRMPLYRLYMSAQDYEKHDADFFQEEASRKTKFCNFLYSNGRNAAKERDTFFTLLSRYKHVDSGGSHLNNIGGRVGDKLPWQRDYKFSIAFENSSKPGYVTEKLFEALQAHTIPIYWGDPLVTKDFNPKRFINCHDYPDFDAVVTAVTELDTNPARYADMLAEPWFAGEIPPLPQDDMAFVGFFRNILDQEPEKAKRVTSHGWTGQYLLLQRFVANTAVPLQKAYLKGEGFIHRIRRRMQ